MSSCLVVGPVGEAGPQGPPGADGMPGLDGLDGAPGTALIRPARYMFHGISPGGSTSFIPNVFPWFGQITGAKFHRIGATSAGVQIDLFNEVGFYANLITEAQTIDQTDVEVVLIPQISLDRFTVYHLVKQPDIEFMLEITIDQTE